MAREQRQLGGAVGQRLKRVEAIFRRHLADRVHASVDVERGEAFRAILDLGNAFSDPVLRRLGRLACHACSPSGRENVARLG